MTNIDIYVLCGELSGRRLSKIVRIPGGYKVKLSGGRDLLVIPGRYVIPTSYVVEADRPDALSLVARKHLGNARIESFEQVNFDRILRIRTERGSVIIESFGDGNVIITNEDDVILYALHERDWKDRSVRRGERYVPPPPPRVFPGISVEEFRGIFTAKDAVRSLVRAGLPPIYAEELCLLAGVDKNTPTSDLGENEILALHSAFARLVDRLNHPEPVAVYDGEELVDVLPVPLSRYDNHDVRRFPSFSDALDVLTPMVFRVTREQPRGREKKSMVDFWRQQLEEARQELSALELMIEKAYEHSYELEMAINAARSGNPPESVGPFRLKRYDGRELVYDFIPPP